MSILKEEQVSKAICEAAAVALEELPQQIGKIHSEIEHKLKINETESTTYTVKLECQLKIKLGGDVNTNGKLKWPRKDGEVSVKGRSIPDPDQPGLDEGSGIKVFDNTKPLNPDDEPDNDE